MRSRFRLAAFVASCMIAGSTIAGCNVESREADLPKDSGVPDAFVRDADPATPSCLMGTKTCGADEWCTAEDECRSVFSQCVDSNECAPGFACAEFTDSGGKLAKVCKKPPLTCRNDNDCELGEVCSAVGWCAPEMIAFVPRLTRCGSSNDCGPGGVCRDGLCRSCEQSTDCRNDLACTLSGRCNEREPCTADNQCFAGNTCMSSRCVRATDTCMEDDQNDRRNNATVIEERFYREPTICGEDTDWYSLEIPVDAGATITVTSTRALSTVSARITNEAGAELEDAAYLSLPGITMIGVPVGSETRKVFLEVTGNDTSGKYAIDVRLENGLCPGDALDLYGDESFDRAALVVPGFQLAMVACNGDRDLVKVEIEEGDTITARAEFGGVFADLDLEIYTSTTGEPAFVGESTNTSTEAVTTGPIFGFDHVYIRAIGKRGPSAGTRYLLDIDRSLGKRDLACTSTTAVLSVEQAFATGTLAGGSDLGAPFECEFTALDPLRNDAIYRIVPPGPNSVVTIRARQISGAATSTLSLSLLSDCLRDDMLISCDASPRPYRDVTLIRQLTSIDPIYAFISSSGSTEDVGFEITATFETFGMPANDICTAATNLAGSEIQSAVTFGAADDARVGSSCGLGAISDGPDRFYRLSLAANERAAVELRGPEGGLLWLSTDCSMLTQTCTVADGIELARPARINLRPRGATNYIVVVDGYGPSSAGAYTLRTVRAPDLECFRTSDCMGQLRCDDYRCVSVPPNDTCPGTPIVLTNGFATIRASTGAANDNFAPRSDCAPARGGLDVAYQVVVPSGMRSLTARITEADFDPILMIRTPGCVDVADEVACNDDLRPIELLLPETSVPNPAAGTYTIIVDAYEGAGPFTLEVELLP